MTNVIHIWLIEHPITQNLLIGLVLFFPALYAKEIRGLLQTPPQRANVWWRKARLNAVKRTLRELMCARNDPSYLTMRLVMAGVQVSTIFVTMLTAIGILLTRLTLPYTSSAKIVLHLSISTLDFSIEMFFVICLYYVLYELVSIFHFVRDLLYFPQAQEKMCKTIEHLELQLCGKTNSSIFQESSRKSSPTAQTAGSREGSVPGAIEPLLASRITPQEQPVTFTTGCRVRHSKYGEGIILRVDGEAESQAVTVQFQNYGIKKLITKFSGLERL